MGAGHRVLYSCECPGVQAQPSHGGQRDLRTDAEKLLCLCLGQMHTHLSFSRCPVTPNPLLCLLTMCFNGADSEPHFMGQKLHTRTSFLNRELSQKKRTQLSPVVDMGQQLPATCWRPPRGCCGRLRQAHTEPHTALKLLGWAGFEVTPWVAQDICVILAFPRSDTLTEHTLKLRS